MIVNIKLVPPALAVDNRLYSIEHMPHAPPAFEHRLKRCTRPTSLYPLQPYIRWADESAVVELQVNKTIIIPWQKKKTIFTNLLNQSIIHNN